LYSENFVLGYFTIEIDLSEFSNLKLLFRAIALYGRKKGLI